MGQVVTEEKIREAKEIYDAHLGPGCFNEEGQLLLHEAWQDCTINVVLCVSH